MSFLSLSTGLYVGITLSLLLIVFSLVKWGNLRCIGVTPVPIFTFIAILFTSGLDVGLIMFPLTEFPVYADVAASPEYGFTNPLAIEFGFWGFWVWSFYFLTSFYFCVIEPRVKFFEIGIVKFINNIVIIGTCAFTGYLFLVNLPWYVPQLGDGATVIPAFYVIVFLTICAAAYSSTDIKYVRILSLGSVWMFLALIVLLWLNAGIGFADVGTLGLALADYFPNVHNFAYPINDYHEFYLFWWFAWSIMIGQFTARFVGGLRVWQLLVALLVFPSIPLAIWFSVLYFHHINSIPAGGLYALAMVGVGIIFVVNSFDSLIRLYTDNLGLTVARMGGKLKYVLANAVVLFLLTIAFSYDLVKIEWIGLIVVGIYIACISYILFKKRRVVSEIKASPEGRVVDFDKIKQIH